MYVASSKYSRCTSVKNCLRFRLHVFQMKSSTASLPRTNSMTVDIVTYSVYHPVYHKTLQSEVQQRGSLAKPTPCRVLLVLGWILTLAADT